MIEKAAELSGAFGYLHLDEVEALMDVAKLVPENGTMINIGAGAGTSSLAVAEIRSDIHIITVDISKGGPLGGMENEKNAFCNAEMEDQLPEQILGDSKEIGKKWEGDKVDLVFVDGDHSEYGVRGDIEAWVQHIKDGGIIVFHDYSFEIWPRVMMVVDELMSGYEEILEIDTLKAFRV